MYGKVPVSSLNLYLLLLYRDVVYLQPIPSMAVTLQTGMNVMLKCEGHFDTFFVTMTQGALCLYEDRTIVGNQIGLSLSSVFPFYCCTRSTI